MNGDSLKKSFLNEIDKDTTIQTLITDNPDAKNIEIKYDVNNDKYTFETTNHVKTYLEKTLKFFNFEDVFKKLENLKIGEVKNINQKNIIILYIKMIMRI